MVGLQVRMSPVVLKIKEMLNTGSVGRLSSEVTMYGTLNRRYAVWSFLMYLEDRILGKIQLPQRMRICLI